MEPIGRKRWAIAEGSIPARSSFSDRTLISHETACILNPGDREAHIDITIFSAIESRSGPIALRSHRAVRCICASTISNSPRLFRATPTIRQFLNQTYPSSCNTRDSIRVTPK